MRHGVYWSSQGASGGGSGPVRVSQGEGPQPRGPQPVGPQPVGPQPVNREAPGPQPVDRAGQESKPKIRAFEQKLAGGRHEDTWERTPNTTGTGAIHVKSFHCRLNEEGLAFLDQQINEWLDAHPQYEVKFVQTSIGEWKGKTVEQNLIVQVWV